MAFVLALIAAFCFALAFFGVDASGHSLVTGGLVVLALAVAAQSTGWYATPWTRRPTP